MVENVQYQTKTEDNPDGVDPAEFQKYFELFARFTAGVGIQYQPSVIVGEDTYQHLAVGQLIDSGFTRRPSFDTVMQSRFSLAIATPRMVPGVCMLLLGLMTPRRTHVVYGN